MPVAAAQIVNLSAIQRGDTIPFVINFSNGVSPVSIAGQTLIMTVKTTVFEEDNAAAILKTIPIAVDDADGLAGTISFNVERSETIVLINGITYRYAIRLITPSSPEDIEQTYIYGELPVEDA